jgi:sulfite reductase beta subunit-like hemoprotein
MAEVPELLERILTAYLAHRRRAGESFYDFAGRHSVEELRGFCAPALAEAAAQ